MRTNSVVFVKPQSDSFSDRRCLIPANGWYVWQKSESGGSSEPWYISLDKGRGFAFGGIWDVNNKCGEKLETCAILTTEATERINHLQHRQPVIIRSEHYDLWLSQKVNYRGALESALMPLDDTLFRAWPVSKAVNSLKNNAPELINNLMLS